jgi:uncharacterized protein (TIGR02145 family)
MERAKTIFKVAGVLILLISCGNMSGTPDNSFGSNSDQTGSKSTQTQTKSTQTTSKSAQTQKKPTPAASKSTQTQKKPTPATSKSAQTKPKSTQTSSKSEPVTMSKDSGIVMIGTQAWASSNLNVSTFRNGDSIPETKTYQEWVTAGESGKPAWCYYNNDPANGLKYGKLYNWYAVNDPRELAPAGWTLSSDADWAELAYYLKGQSMAGIKMKTISGWSDGNNGTNESGFTGLPGGYRVENGTFLKQGIIGAWWSSSESNSRSAIDHYLAQSLLQVQFDLQWKWLFLNCPQLSFLLRFLH